jgi:hypothetical protein
MKVSSGVERIVARRLVTAVIGLCFLIANCAPSVQARQKKSDVPEGFEIYLKVPEATVITAVKSVIEEDAIQGTWIYDTDKVITGAVSETSSDYYGQYKGNGHVYYKVLHNALAPRHFKDAADVGTLTVRYVVEGVGPAKTRVQIDAAFVEDGNHKVHASDTTVETSEFAEVQSHIVEIQKQEREAAELTEHRKMLVDSREAKQERNEEIARLDQSEASLTSLQQKVNELHQKLEVQVKSEPVDLKSAPFNRAAKLTSLPGHSELLVEIITDYWYGVETVEGRRGWVRQDQVEPIP